jgi:hypothetical protein
MPRGDRWYWSKVYNGPWIVVEYRHVPVQVTRVPRDYRVRYRKVKQVPYGQWKKTHSHKSYEYSRNSDHPDSKHHKNNGKRGNGDDY